MIRTTGNKKDFVPLKRLNKYTNLYLVQWDFRVDNDPESQEPTEIGSWMQEIVKTTPTEQSLRKLIHGYYNKETDRKILEGFTWHEHKVWLSTENQFNYKAAYDLAVQTNGGNLPITFKFGSDDNVEYHTFETLEELSDFYLSAMKYINTMLEEGWKLKDSFKWEEYKRFIIE